MESQTYTTQDLLADVINRIEAEKEAVRAEYQELRDAVMRQPYRAIYGLNKTGARQRMERWHGRIIGLESALSVLYREVEQEEDGE